MTAAVWSPSSATKTLTRHLKINAFDSQTDFQMYKEQEQEQQQQQKTCQAQQSVNAAGSSFNKIGSDANWGSGSWRRSSKDFLIRCKICKCGCGCVIIKDETTENMNRYNLRKPTETKS